MEPHLFAEVLTQDPLTSERAARSILGCVEKSSWIRPQKIGAFEPARTPYEGVTSAIDIWEKYCFLWKAEGPRTSGHVVMEDPANRRHAFVKMSCLAANRDAREFATVAEELSQRLHADLMVVHPLTAESVVRGRATDTIVALDRRRESFSMILTTHELVLGLPDLYWVTGFGAPYIEMIGRDRLRSTPGFRVWEPERDLVVIQLTESDISPELEGARARAVEHIGTEFFIGSSSSPTVPDFGF